MRQVVGGARTWEFEGVDDGLYRAVDVVAIRPWRAKLYGRFSSFTSVDRLILTLAEEAKVMLQGVGARFDFHMCKTLCDLRCAGFLDLAELADFPFEEWAKFSILLSIIRIRRGPCRISRSAPTLPLASSEMTDPLLGMFAKGGSTITACPSFAKGVRIDQVPSGLR